MANYQFGTEESYNLLLAAGMPKHSRMSYHAGAAMIASARLMTGHSSQGISVSKVHPKDARDILTMHALRWIVMAHDADGIAFIEDMKIFDDPIDGYDEDPAAEAALNIHEGASIRGKCDLLDTIVAAALAVKEHEKAS